MADVDNQEVYKIICNAMGVPWAETLGDRIGEAFDSVTSSREEAAHRGDVNFASAEHYLFARYVICWTGYVGMPFVVGAIAGYVFLKQHPILRRLAAVGKGPVTPASLADLYWQKSGCSDGLVDFNASPMSAPTNARFPQRPPANMPAPSGLTANMSLRAGAADAAASAGAAGRIT